MSRFPLLVCLTAIFLTASEDPCEIIEWTIEYETNKALDYEDSSESLEWTLEEEPGGPFTTIDQSQASTQIYQEDPIDEEQKLQPLPEKNWYFEVKPGYYYFTNSTMRQFFDNGGFTIRGEAGYKLWGPLDLWFDGSYFHKDGHTLESTEGSEMMLATLSLGLKLLWIPKDYLAFYAGAAPRIFLMTLHNDSPFVRSDDNEIGLGAGFQGGFWIMPIPQYRDLFFDFFGDYSWKTMVIEPDEVSSDDYDLDISGISFGVGIGVRF